MKSKVILTVLLFLLVLDVAGQTVDEIETKYGKPENVYSVSENIWMTPAYASDGQVCMIRLYPKLISSDTNYLDAKLKINEVLEIIDQLVPGSTRGARIGFFGMSEMGGGVVWTHFNYDRVHFTFVSSFKLDKLPDREPETVGGQGFDFSSVDKASQKEWEHREVMRSDNELIRERSVAPKVVEIRWIDRKCVGK